MSLSVKRNTDKCCGGLDMIDLQKCRDEIDFIDQKMVALFQQRMEVSKQVADYKRSTGKKIFDKAREDAVLEKIGDMAENEFQKHCLQELFSQIMSMSRKLQYSMVENAHTEMRFEEVDSLNLTKDTKIVYLGPENSYSNQAMEDYFGTEVDSFSAGSFREIMEAIQSGKAEYGVLPIENTSTGGITDIYDLLSEYENYIIGEHVIKIQHALLGVEGTKMEEIQTVYSHQQGIKQCNQFLEEHPNMKTVELSSTTLGAKKVCEDQDRTQAAIASTRAAKSYGLTVLKEGINQEDNNATRFIIISNKKMFIKGANKMSISFVAPHVSGSLYQMLSHLIFNNLNMTKIESRPLKGKSFEYRFFVDFEGNLNAPAVKNTLNGIYEEAIQLKILGNYSEK